MTAEQPTADETEEIQETPENLNISEQPDEETLRHVRMAEALLFAAVEPLDEGSLAVRLPEGANIPEVIALLQVRYENRGVNLTKVAGKWAFRTAPDLAHILQREVQTPRRLSRAAVETLAIVAYHQPVTRAEIEQIRGVSISRGTLDLLIETGWVRLAGRRRTPGRPVTYGITDGFLEHFGLEDVKDLPGVKELKAAGLLDTMPPLNYGPTADPDEENQEDDETEEGLEEEVLSLIDNDDVTALFGDDAAEGDTET